MRFSKKKALFLGLFTLFAFVLRVWNIDNHYGLWLDELIGFFHASQASVFAVVKSLLQNDINAPLFYILLHFWVKFFGRSDVSLWMLPVLLSTISVPVAYVVVRRVLGGQTAVLASVFLALSSFQIYYAQELKFYSLLVLLSLLGVYFWSSLKDNFSSKNLALYSLLNILTIYTFNLGVLFFVLQVILSLFFVDRVNLKKYFKATLIVLLFYVPYLYFQLKTFLSVNKSICTLQEMFHFDLSSLKILLQNFFSPYFICPTKNFQNYSFFSLIDEPFKFCVVLFSILLAFVGIGFSLRAKNKLINCIFVLALLFVVIELILAAIGVIPFVTRYTMLAHSLFLIVVAFGLVQIRQKYVVVIVVVIWSILSLFVLFTDTNSPLNKGASHYPIVAQKLQEHKVRQNDVILMPFYGYLLEKYLPDSNIAQIQLEKAIFSSDSLSRRVFFDSYFDVNRNEIKTKLYPYLSSNQPPKSLDNFISSNIFNQLMAGDRVFLVITNLEYILPHGIYSKILLDEAVYREIDLFPLVYSATLRKLQLACEQKFRFVEKIDMSDLDILIFIYEKS